MTLEQAKAIADNTQFCRREEIEAALIRLRLAGVRARFRNAVNERSRERYHGRLERLQNAIEACDNADEAKRVS